MNSKIKGKEKERLENLGFGIEKKGELILNPYETRYCKEKGYLESKEKFKGNESIYRVFKELREHGIIIRFSKDSELIRVYQKGFRPGEDRTKYLMKVVEKKFPSKEELKELIISSKKMRKELVIALVEERISYLKINSTNLF